MVLALTAAVVLFLFIAGPGDTPLGTLQRTSQRRILTASPWYHFSERPLNNQDIDGLVPLLNDLERADFTEDRSMKELSPEYGLRLNGDTILISQADAIAGCF
jgi:hypothetical protein